MVLLDEPSVGLAPVLVREIFRIIGEINQSGTTVLLVEQNANMALRCQPGLCAGDRRHRFPAPVPELLGNPREGSLPGRLIIPLFHPVIKSASTRCAFIFIRYLMDLANSPERDQKYHPIDDV